MMEDSPDKADFFPPAMTPLPNSPLETMTSVLSDLSDRDEILFDEIKDSPGTLEFSDGLSFANKSDFSFTFAPVALT